MLCSIFIICGSMATEQSADEDRVIQSKAPEKQVNGL